MLTFAFGPFGLLYLSFRAALMLSTISLVRFVVANEAGGSLITFLLWSPISMKVGFILADRANRGACLP